LEIYFSEQKNFVLVFFKFRFYMLNLQNTIYKIIQYNLNKNNFSHFWVQYCHFDTFPLNGIIFVEQA
jgi:hypothetical protein